jgi:hypothetical protein
MFPPKKKKQLEKEQQKEDVEEQKFQMSPKQLREKGVSEGYKPDFDYAFGATAPPKGEMTPAQVAFGDKAPPLPESASGRAIETPATKDVAAMLARQAGGPAGIAATILGKQLLETETDPEAVLGRIKKREAEAR